MLKQQSMRLNTIRPNSLLHKIKANLIMLNNQAHKIIAKTSSQQTKNQPVGLGKLRLSISASKPANFQYSAFKSLIKPSNSSINIWL